MISLKQILVASGDAEASGWLQDQLMLRDFQVVTAGAAASAIDAVRKGRFDLALLDTGLPDLEGREACRILRKNGFHLPIILVGAEGSDAEVILGLEAGANDCISKPLKVDVLLARIRALLRRYERSDEAVFSVGPYRFMPSAKVLLEDNGSRIRLTKKETSLLKHLLRAGAGIVTREALLTEVWGYHRDASSHTVETHVYRLRQKIEKNGLRAGLLLTERGGYRLAQ